MSTPFAAPGVSTSTRVLPCLDRISVVAVTGLLAELSCSPRGEASVSGAGCAQSRAAQHRRNWKARRTRSAVQIFTLSDE